MESTDKKTGPANPLIGSGIEPTVLDNSAKVDIDIEGTIVDSILNTGLTSQFNIDELEKFTSIANSREQIYQLIDSMANDSTVSSIIRTYAEDACEPDDHGHIMWCESNDTKISKFVNYLLNVMNVDKHIFSWAYNLVKYGDTYLRLFRESDYDDDFFKKAPIKNAMTARTSLNEDLFIDMPEVNEARYDSLENINENVNLKLHDTNDHYSYYVEMVADPGSMFELTKFGKTYGYVETPAEANGSSFMVTPIAGGDTQITQSYRMRSNDINVYQADEFVHGCLEDGTNRYPEMVELFTEDAVRADGTKYTIQHSYRVKRGKSLLYDSYKVWREKSLLEGSAILNRVTRSSVVRKIGVEVGDLPKEKVKETLRMVKSLFETKSAINVGEGMSEYVNPGPVENNIYYATRGGVGNINVDSVGGDVDVKGLADLDWWNNKFYSSYGIPKQYFGWTDDAAGFNGGSTLSVISSSYAKGVKRIQNALIQMVTDCINLFLLDRGCRSYLNNFTLKMKAPITQEEVSYREALSNKITAISNLQALFSDVEDRGRKLTILKSLVATLNYGDDIIAELDKEIEAFEQQKQAAEEAAKEAELEAGATLEAEGDISTDAEADTALPAVDEITLESFDMAETDGTALLEIMNAESTYLPTPEELQ